MPEGEPLEGGAPEGGGALEDHGALSERALGRALKRSVWSATLRLRATCAPGFEELLAAEIAGLPSVSGVAGHPGGVAWSAPFDTALLALLRLRTAQGLSVTLLEHAAASTAPMLFAQLSRLRWPLWVAPGAVVRLRVKSRKSRLRDDEHLRGTLERVLERAGVGAHPEGVAAEADPLTPTLTLRLDRDRASVLLDVGGALHHRGAIKWIPQATLRATTAAALARLAFGGSGDAQQPVDTADAPVGVAPLADLIVDPFGGAGTLPIEALALLEDAPIDRSAGVPWMMSPSWKVERWAAAQRAARSLQRRRPAPTTLLFDLDPEALHAAEHNVAARGYRGAVAATRVDAATLDLAALARQHGAQRPLLLSNPPYGKVAQALGRPPGELLRRLLARAPGWRFVLLYPRPEELRAVPGVRLERIQSVITGGMPNSVLVGRIDPR